MLYEKKVDSKQIFIEVARSELVRNYIGHTATKTALAGVLFIDEA